MIEEFPWIAPVLSWIIVLVLLALVVLAAFTTKRATHNDYLATLIGSLMLAIAGTTTAMLTVIPRGAVPLDIIGMELAILRGVASVLYLGVLMHMLGLSPAIGRRIDCLFDRMMPNHRIHKDCP